MRIAKALLTIGLALLSCHVSAAPSIQIIPNPGGVMSCKQAMVSNNSNHVYYVEITYVYTGVTRNADGDYSNYQHSSFWNFHSHPGTAYHPLSSFIIDCDRGPALNYNVKFTDITAQQEAEAANQQRARDEMQRRADESVRRQQEEQRRREQARIDEENRRKQAAADAAAERQRRQIEANQQAEQARWQRIEEYRRADPMNALCLIQDVSDIPKCEQAKQRRREVDALEDAKRQEADRKAREAEEFKRLENEGRIRQQNEERERAEWMRNSPCEAADAHATQLQQLKAGLETIKNNKSIRDPQQAIHQSQQQIQHVTAIKASLDKACEAKDPRVRQMREQARAEEQRRIEAERQRIEADRQRSLETSRKWEQDEKANTQKMKSNNEELLRMLNDIR